MKWDSIASSEKIEAEMPFEKRLDAKSVYALLSRTVTKYSGRPAVSFQLDSDPKAKAETLNWGQLLARVTQAANGFKSLGVSQENKIAYILPICTEAVVSFVSGHGCRNCGAHKSVVRTKTNRRNTETCRG